MTSLYTPLPSTPGFLYRKHLAKMPLFSNLEPAFLVSVSLRMRIVTFTPRETIFRAGDLGLEMYIIRKGCVAVVGKHNQLMSVLGPGEAFGEIALFTQVGGGAGEGGGGGVHCACGLVCRRTHGYVENACWLGRESATLLGCLIKMSLTAVCCA